MYDERWRWSSSPSPASTAAEGGGEGAGMGHRHRGQGADPLGVTAGHDPGHHGPPVVADQVEAVHAPARRRRPGRRRRARRCGSRRPPAGRAPGRVAPLVEGERRGSPAAPRPSSWWCHEHEVWGKPCRKSTGAAVGRARRPRASNVSPLAATSSSCIGRPDAASRPGRQPSTVRRRSSERASRATAGRGPRPASRRSVSSGTALDDALAAGRSGGRPPGTAGPARRRGRRAPRRGTRRAERQLDVLGHRGPAEQRGPGAGHRGAPDEGVLGRDAVGQLEAVREELVGEQQGVALVGPGTPSSRPRGCSGARSSATRSGAPVGRGAQPVRRAGPGRPRRSARSWAGSSVEVVRLGPAGPAASAWTRP